MLKYSLILFFSFRLYAGIYPDYQGQMNDNENLLPKLTEWHLKHKIERKNKQTNRALLLLTVPNYADQTNSKDYLIKLYQHWNLGTQFFENAVILFVSKSKSEVRLFVGKNISPSFPKNERQRILDKVIRPAVKKENYKKGIKKGMKEILQFL